MSDKISSDKVPEKFAEWLLSMGCPADKVPAIDKVSEMCRGQYYMVWRSMMEHVEPKDIIRKKRMQVFCDDVRRCRKKQNFNQHDSSIIVPEELVLWQKKAEVNERLQNTIDRVSLVKQDLNQLMDKTASKTCQRDISYRRSAELQRRAWLLQHVAEELKCERSRLLETRAIADSLCAEPGADIQSKLDKCLTSLRRQKSPPIATGNPVANSTLVATNEDHEFEEHLMSLVRCRGDALCSQLYERRAGLIKALAIGDSKPDIPSDRVTPQSVVTHTAALHCNLALEATKNKVHLKQAKKKLAAAVSEINNYLTGESCELLVLKCERVHTETRIGTLRCLLDDLAAGDGIFRVGGGGGLGPLCGRNVASVDMAIESQRDELKRVTTSLLTTERKIQNAKECLVAVFNGFSGSQGCDLGKYRGVVELPPESVSSLRQFYAARREMRLRNADLSFELDGSFASLGNGPPSYVDELKIYMQKFDLEKNRKLVLESGEKIWIFESLQASIQRMHSNWLKEELACSLLPPTRSLEESLRRLGDDVLLRRTLESMARQRNEKQAVKIDIKPQTEEEQEIKDKIKKMLKDSLVTLQKTTKALESGHYNLRIWADNSFRKYISANRIVEGMTYNEYERYYLDNCIDV